MQHVTEERRTLGELFSDLAKETGTLVRQEAALAKSELTQKAKNAASDGAVVGIGVVLAALGGLGLFAGLILLLGTVMPLWAAAFLVGGIFVAGGAGVAWFGVRALKRIDATPRVTVRTLKENKQWLTEQMAR